MKPLRFTLVLFAAMTLWAGAVVHATATDPDCVSEADKVPCLAAKGDPMAMYVMGRRAYDAGRVSGNLTEALAWGQRVVKVRRHTGNMLLKMVYLQLGEGVHHDYVQAHVWLREAIDSSEANLYLIPWLERLEAKMETQQIERARELAAN